MSDDPSDYPGMPLKEYYEKWWRENFTPEEIVKLAAYDDGPPDVLESEAPPAICEAEGCDTKFFPSANQRYCSHPCWKAATAALHRRAKKESRKRYDERQRAEYIELTDRLGVTRDWARMRSHLSELRAKEAA